MVSTVLNSWSIGELNNLSGKCESPESEACSTFEDNFNVIKPLTVSNGHIDLPEIFQQNDESEGIFTKLLGNNNKSKNPNDDNSDEIFNSHVNRDIRADLKRTNAVDKVFERYDDPYAKFYVPKTPKTPGPSLCSDDMLLSPPKTPSTKSWKYVTLEEREARRKAALEGQRDICEVLIKKGIDPNEYISSVFSTGKKNNFSCKKFNFQCSTPKTDTFSECISTPLAERSNINTPISGIKKLPCFNGETNNTPNFLHLNFTHHSDVSLNATFSPVHDLSPTTKSSLLSGIVCYVEVRSEKEDMSSSVQEELRSLGARIEKNFTKKVTHVVFKEGRVSTYLKAKKEGIPLVGVLWIEACKRVRGLADPAQYPPKRMAKYESILPFETIKKRRLRFYNPNSKIRKNILEHFDDPNFVPTLNGRKLAAWKAATLCKDKVSDSSEDKENKGIKKYCTKKLLFDKLDDNPLDQLPKQKESVGDSSHDSALVTNNAVLRRKSAPAKLVIKKSAKKPRALDPQKKEKKILSSNDSVCSKQNNNEVKINSDNENDKKNLEDVNQMEEVGVIDNAPPKKKRKLYDPSEVYVSLDEGEITQESLRKQLVEDKVTKRPRTKATASRQLIKLALARKRGSRRLKTDLDDDDNGSSPSTFVTDNSTDQYYKSKKRKECRSIVFTSVHRSDLPKYVEMVKKLGRFVVENEVTKNTTHVVCNGPRRTLNLIKGIARGCWVLDIKWLVESMADEKWLPEDSYILSDNYPCVTECCRERRGLKTSHVIDIFKDVGSIYVSRPSNPSKKDLDQLLKICCANLSKSSNTADIKVGGSIPNSNTSGVWVSEKWIIDSITKNCLLPFDPYLMKIDKPVMIKESQSSQI